MQRRVLPLALSSLVSVCGVVSPQCHAQSGDVLSFQGHGANAHARATVGDGFDATGLKLDINRGLANTELFAEEAEEPLPSGRLLIEPVSFGLWNESQPEEGAPSNGQAAAGDSAASPSTNSQNDANNPLTPKITINFHNYYVPSYYGLEDRHSDQFLLRGVIPHKIGDVPQLFRFTLPIADVPTFPDGSDTGLGDLTLIDYFVFKESGLEIGVGPLLVAPTASTEALGAGKWQAGASGLVVAPQKWGLLGGVLTFQQSFASQGGDLDRDDVTLLQFQPLAIYNLPEGFYLRSTAIWNFDLNNGTYYLPVGLGAGYVHEFGRITVNAFVEPQFTVFHDGVAPQWQVFAGVNFQIKF